MTDSPQKPKIARERAFEIFEAAGGRIKMGEIFSHLIAEGYEVRENNISVWKARDKWAKRIPKGSKGKGIIGLQRLLVAPKIEKIAELDRVEKMGAAGEDILHTATLIANKLRSRVDSLQPKEISVKDIGPMIQCIGELFAHCAAIDAEVARRKGDLAKDISKPGAPSQSVIEHSEIPAIQLAAKEFAQQLITVRRIT